MVVSRVGNVDLFLSVAVSYTQDFSAGARHGAAGAGRACGSARTSEKATPQRHRTTEGRICDLSSVGYNYL